MDLERIQEITRTMDSIYDVCFRGVKSEDGRQQAYAEYHSETALLENEREWLRQKPILQRARSVGLPIPIDKYEEREAYMHHLLSIEGAWWLRNELRAYRMTIAKDWVAILLPILSSAIAILGLIVALRKR